MTSLPTILAEAIVADDALNAAIPPNWMQGRTTYGGLSASLALHASQQLIGDLPPLRSAMLSFVAPLAGRVRATARVIRRGRNAVFVTAQVAGENGVGLIGELVFVNAIASTLSHRVSAPPQVPRPEAADRTFTGRMPEFISNFDYVDDRAAPSTEWRRWLRLREREGLDPMVEMLAVADALPPAALKLIGGPAPVSTITWQCNLLAPVPTTRDGWWLLRSSTDHAADGCSSQTMQVWNADGELVVSGMQSVAIFA